MIARKKFVRAGAAVAALGATLTIGLAGNSPANADPKQFSAFAGFGSDTTEQVTNALAGYSNGVNYTPLQAGTTQTQLVSWDATPDNQCFSPKPGAPTIHRPNGSSEGRAMLSHAALGDGYGSAACGGLKNVSGMIHYARSSSFVNNATGDLTYIPFSRDALSFAYYRASGGAPVTQLTTAQLQSLYTSGPQVIGGVNIIPCGIQTGSGTFQFWNSALGISSSENAATETCRNLDYGDANGRIQENSSHDLKAKGDLAPAGSQVIVGFSAANYIAKANGVAPDGIAVGVDMGEIDALGKPYTGTTTLAPSATFYASTTFGRYVAVVVRTATITGPGEFALKAMFTNSTVSTVNVDGDGLAEICEPDAQAIVNKFGFLSDAAECGTLTHRGPYITSQPS